MSSKDFAIIAAMVGSIFIGIVVGLYFAKKSQQGWTTFVGSEWSVHYINAPFINMGNSCYIAMIDSKVMVQCRPWERQ